MDKLNRSDNTKESLILDEKDLKNNIRNFIKAYESGDKEIQSESRENIEKFVDVNDVARFYHGHIALLIEEDENLLNEGMKNMLTGLLALMNQATGGVKFGMLVGSGLENLENYFNKFNIQTVKIPLRAGAFTPDAIYNQTQLCLNSHPNIPELQKLHFMMLTFRKNPFLMMVKFE